MSGKVIKKSELAHTSTGQCVWVDAGVISYRLCTLNYDCEHCSLHQALIDGPMLIQPNVAPGPSRTEVEERRAEFYEFFEKLPASARKCRYMLSGDVSYKLCINAFRCATCSFGQMMEDSAEADGHLSVIDSQTIEGFSLPRGLHYHRSHAWVHMQRDGNVRIGLNDFGQRLLGPIQDVRLPGAGEAVFEGIPACEARLKTGWIGMLAPISGRVTAINEKLLKQPGLVNNSPYTKGWLLEMKPSDMPLELSSLLYGVEAKRWFEMEIGRVKEKTKGGNGQGSIHELLKDASWRGNFIDEMVCEFLLARSKKAA